MNNELKIVMLDTDKIKPYHRNARDNDETVTKLCEIIPKVGFNVPILVDKNYIIIKGHSRWKAGVRLGLKQLPCIISENDEETNKLDRLADNKIQEFSAWNMEILNTELASLNIDFDITDIGFDIQLDEIKMPDFSSFEPVSYPSIDNTQNTPVAPNMEHYEPTTQPIPQPTQPTKEFITEKDIERTVSKVNNEYGSVTCPQCGNVVLYKK